MGVWRERSLTLSSSYAALTRPSCLGMMGGFYFVFKWLCNNCRTAARTKSNNTRPLRRTSHQDTSDKLHRKKRRPLALNPTRPSEKSRLLHRHVHTPLQPPQHTHSKLPHKENLVSKQPLVKENPPPPLHTVAGEFADSPPLYASQC